MFVCYLDDSGKDPKNPITTLAGYVARDAAWSLFERNVEPVFKEFGVEVLHARDLHNTDRDFKGWSRDKKEKFVSRVCEAMAPQVPLGLSFSVDKEIYEAIVEKERESCARSGQAHSMHARDLHTDRDFKGWSRDKKENR